MLESRLSKQSFRWHQPDLRKRQFYNSRSRWAVFLNDRGIWKVTWIMWNWLMENLITQMLVKKSLFVTNKVFHEIIVTTCRFAYLHTLTAWQATVLTEMRTWKFHFLEQTLFLMTLSTLFTYANRATSHGIAKFSNKIIEWKATCPKPPLHVRSWSLTNKENWTTQTS